MNIVTDPLTYGFVAYDEDTYDGTNAVAWGPTAWDAIQAYREEYLEGEPRECVDPDYEYDRQRDKELLDGQ